MQKRNTHAMPSEATLFIEVGSDDIAFGMKKVPTPHPYHSKASAISSRHA